ncbi:MAG: excinuclease ABC subunit UvrC [Gammaproteobacteria bacterium]|nr:excinuclease ABC subunit UvrC [Gammaproteobacteria bacterium]
MPAQEDLKHALETMTHYPGVYRMLDAAGTLLYVGKAKDLKKRVASYFGKRSDSPKTRAMVKQVCAVEVTVTRTEAEALLLESNLIKQHKPRYNVVLRDDKSYPYLYLSGDREFPRLSFYRGAKSGAGQYFGPYPSAKSARCTLNLTQKLFKIRQCDDNFFKHRSRPCLQYQIKRCTAPCVGLVDAAVYQQDVKHSVMFLEGRNEDVIEELTVPMQQAADRLDYERAAQYRDQISSLRKIQESQYVSAPKGELDLVACAMAGGQACVQVFFIRGGLNLGNKVFFPSHTGELTQAQVLNAFLPQYYLTGSRNRQTPAEVLLSHNVADAQTLTALLSERKGKAVRLKHKHRSERKQWMAMALNNAAIALQSRLSAKDKYLTRFENLQDALRLNEPVMRVECFDVSHTGGEATVASCVVFNEEGAVKADYRKFNIKDVPAGDDYAAIAQAFSRRYSRVRKTEGKLPDLILIDGGKGQVGAVRSVAEELQIDEVALFGVAKGRSRKPGLERLVFSDGKNEMSLPADSSALHLIQEIRDEAHRFAITGHRQQRSRKRTQSALEDIAGVGAKRRRELIRYFGGLQAVSRAGVEELARTPGISNNLAEKIYASLHGDE